MTSKYSVADIAVRLINVVVPMNVTVRESADAEQVIQRQLLRDPASTEYNPAMHPTLNLADIG
jgi:hypothetical protein